MLNMSQALPRREHISNIFARLLKREERSSLTSCYGNSSLVPSQRLPLLPLDVSPVNGFGLNLEGETSLGSLCLVPAFEGVCFVYVIVLINIIL